MREFVTPNVFISACIEFDACRYDGSKISDDFVKRLKEVVHVTKICPELMMGLGSPRDSLRLVQDGDTTRLLQSSNGHDFTDQMSDFSQKFADKLLQKDIDGMILKAKSPSCGIQNVKLYEGLGKARVITSKHYGVFGGIMKQRFPSTPIETERRLSNYTVRDRFFTELFVLASFRKVKQGSYKDLVKFHTENKYLFMTYNQSSLKRLGNIVANHDHIDRDMVKELYEAELRLLLSKPATQKRRVNVFTHIYGYFKNDVSTEEKEYYFDLLDDYLTNKIPYTSILALLRGWTVRFKEPYLLSQTIFEPYPKELTMMLDSGKRI